MSNTKIRGVRIPDYLWRKASRLAAEEGTDVSAVIRRLLIDYCNKS